MIQSNIDPIWILFVSEGRGCGIRGWSISDNFLNKKKLWDFQEVRHDIWNLDIPAPPILGSITRNKKKIDVVIALTKLGNTLVLDRISGKPIFDFHLKKAPKSKIPGEKTAYYQPNLKIPLKSK